jgi:hypothetical protein
MGLVMAHHKELFFSDGDLDPTFTDKKIELGSFHNSCGILNLSRFSTPVPSLNKKFKEMYQKNKKTETK